MTNTQILHLLPIVNPTVKPYRLGNLLKKLNHLMLSHIAKNNISPFIENSNHIEFTESTENHITSPEMS